MVTASLWVLKVTIVKSTIKHPEYHTESVFPSLCSKSLVMSEFPYLSTTKSIFYNPLKHLLNYWALIGSTATWLFSKPFCLVQLHILLAHRLVAYQARIFFRNPRFTFLVRLSFSNFAWLQSIIRRISHLGYLKSWAMSADLHKYPSSIMSTIDPRSPAFLESRSGAQVG